MDRPNEGTAGQRGRYRRMARRVARWLCPSLLELCYGASFLTACPLPPPQLLSEALAMADLEFAAETSIPPSRPHPAADRRTSLSAAELRAWQSLVRDLSSGSNGNSLGPEW